MIRGHDRHRPHAPRAEDEEDGDRARRPHADAHLAETRARATRSAITTSDADRWKAMALIATNQPTRTHAAAARQGESWRRTMKRAADSSGRTSARCAAARAARTGAKVTAA